MRYSNQRKSTPKVVDGRVQKKNRHDPTPNIWNNATDHLLFEKDRPGKGFFHAVSKSDLIAFIDLIPNWTELSVGLKGIRLVEWDEDADAWYDHDRVICLCAWDRELWRYVTDAFYQEHRALLERLGVPVEESDGDWLCKYTPETARAYQLLHVFLHELGHHHDLMTTQRKKQPGRGEPYAQNFAFKYEAVIWDGYAEVFGLTRAT